MYIPALFLLLAGRVALVQAHGFVKTWSVDGVSQPGYTPCNPAGVENENTAERGKYRLVLVTDGQVLPIILQQALLAEE
jgi:hypothetical protein